MSRLRLFLLGPLRLELDGQPIKLESRKTSALLVYLAMTGKRYQRDTLVDLFWPDKDASHGKLALRHILHILHNALPEGWIQADRESIGLSATADLWLDVHEFQHILLECHHHAHLDEETCPDCLEALSKAVALYHQDFMSGFSLSASSDFDDWQFFQAEGLRQKLDEALRKRVWGLILRGDYTAAIEPARRRLVVDGLNEEAHCVLMLLYSWTHQLAAARRQHQVYKNAIESQLGINSSKIDLDLVLNLEIGRTAVLSRPVEIINNLSGIEENLPEGSNKETVTAPWPAVPGIAEEGNRNGSAMAVFPHQHMEEKRFLTVMAYEIRCLSASDKFSPSEEKTLVESERQEEQFLKLAQLILKLFRGKTQSSVGKIGLAVFGLGYRCESDPGLAFRAARDLRAASQAIGLYLTVGITTGTVCVRKETVGTADVYVFTGAAVDHALHLASQASSGMILVGGSTPTQPTLF